MSEQTLDARGKPCPEPVVAARRILIEERPERLRVIVDNSASAENVSRMARSLGRAARIERQEPGEIHLLISGEMHPTEACARPSQVVVFVGSDELGAGDAELGALLMRAFLKTLREVVPQPQALLFMNGGVRLTVEGSPLLEDIRELERRGARVRSCGTCLDYFRLKERLAVGQVTNMFEVVSLLAGADRVIRP